MKILIVKTSSIGDIIQSFPVIEYLKKRHAVIDWVVEKEYEGLIRSHPDIRRAITLQSRSWRKFRSWRDIQPFVKALREEYYDVLFDLQGNTKSACITFLARANDKVGFGWESLAEFPNFFATKTRISVDQHLQIQKRYLQLVQKFYDDPADFIPQGVSLHLEEIAVPPNCVMVACGSKWSNKTLSELTLENLVRKIAEQDHPHFYFIWGNPEEKERAERLQEKFGGISLGNLSFPVWQALMRKMKLVVAVDSAALALCGTTQTPSLSFFGPSRASIYKPLGEHHIAWQGPCPYGQAFETRCPRLRTCRTGSCLKKADAEELFSFLQKSPRR